MLQILYILRKDFLLEMRNKYAINGIILYVIGSVFVCYLSFNVKKGIIHPITWNALFWIIILFCAINASSKSFAGERDSRNWYYYTLVNPVSYIIAKIIYNTLLLLFLGVLAIGTYSLVMGNPVHDVPSFVACLVLSSVALASTLSLVSAIASKASNNGTLMAILSFPLVLPILLLVIKISKNAIDGIDVYESYKAFIMLGGINLIVLALAYILFPYIWKN